MKKNDQIVAELNQSVPRVRRFCYDIEPEDVVTFPRVTRSDKPDFHVLEDNQEVTLPLTSTPTHSSDFSLQVPLPPLKPRDSFNSGQSLENSLQILGDVQKQQLDFWQLVDEGHDQPLAVQITETIPEEPKEGGRTSRDSIRECGSLRSTFTTSFTAASYCNTTLG